MHSQPTPTTISVPAAVLLGVSITAATILGLIIAFQYVHPLKVHEGTTALLASLTVLFGTGFIICTVTGRALRRQDEFEERVMQRLAGIEAKATAQEPRTVGHAYVPRSTYERGARRQVDADTMGLPARVQTATDDRLDTPDAARTQGYAEGYVDGIARRQGDDPALN